MNEKSTKNYSLIHLMTPVKGILIVFFGILIFFSEVVDNAYDTSFEIEILDLNKDEGEKESKEKTEKEAKGKKIISFFEHIKYFEKNTLKRLFLYEQNNSSIYSEIISPPPDSLI
jgi:hypothetical protein